MNTVLNWLATVPESTTQHGLLPLAKITLLLALAWLFHAALGRSNPRWRVLLWRCTCAGTALLMLMAVSPPFLKWPILPRPQLETVATTSQLPRAAALDELPSEAVPARTALQRRPERDHAVSANPGDRHDISADKPRPSFPDANGEHANTPAITATTSAGPAIGIGSETRSERASLTISSTVSSPATVSSGNTGDSRSRLSLLQWFVAIWCAGTLLGILRLGIGMTRLGRIRQTAARVPAWVESEAATVAAALGLQRPVAVRQTNQLQTPCIVGVFRPLLFLPECQCQVEHRDELPSILAHELAHLKGGDLLWNAIFNGLSIVLWFHPLVWRVRLMHSDACDAVCDILAADYVGDAVIYGRTLARLTLRVDGREMMAGLAMARSSCVTQRIEAVRRNVFHTTIPRAPASCAGGLALAAIGLFGGLALTHSQAAPPEAGNKPVAADKSVAAQKPADGEKKDAPPANAKPAAPPTVRTENVTARMTITTVVEKTGKPLAGARLQIHGTIGGQRVNANLATDEEGVARFDRKALAKVEHLWMTVSAPGFVPQHYTWRSNQRPIELQEQIDLRFEAGNEIGGVVKDEQGRPIAGAGIDLTMPITWPRLESYVFTCAELKTDEQGRWKWDGAPADVAVSIRVRHADYLPGGAGATNGLNNVVVLKQGLQVAGRVVDGGGRPISGAAAVLGFDRWGTNDPTTTTDDEGRFVLKNCKAGKSLVTVQAEGFSPKFQNVTVGEQEKPLEFALEAGRTIHVRIVDTDGRPLGGVHFGADTWQAYRTLDFRTKSDARGEAVWRSAPAEAVLCYALLPGYMSNRDLPLKPSDDVQIVTLSPELIISGDVTDAATGEPIKEFRVRQGQTFANTDQIYWSRDEAAVFKDGRFRLKFGEPAEGRLLQIEATGYAPATSRLFKSTEGEQTFDFALKPGQGPMGIVFLPNGDLAAGAEVGLATAEKRVTLKLGRFDRRQNGAEIVKTDAEGRFAFPSQDTNAFLLVVVHEAGFADVLSKELQESNRINLRGWGRLKGSVLEGAKPDAQREVGFYPQQPDSRRIYPFVWQYDYSTQTGAAGEFEFDRVMPGPGSVFRVVVTEFNQSTQHTPGWQAPVEIMSGEVALVTVGGTGRPVTGKVKLDRQPDVTIDWTTNEPATIERWDKSQKQRDKSYARFIGNLLKSGRFTIPDVPAGDYKLWIPVNNPPTPNACGPGTEIGRAELEFTIPEIAGGRSDEPLDLGEVTAVLADTLDPGEPAPEFVAARLDEGTLRLSEFRGKLILIDFWATWCGPCLAEMPGFQKIHERFGNDPRFVLLGLSCDNSAEVAKRYVESKGLGWKQAFVGNTQGHVPTQYTVRALPATFLIGPSGRVLAKNLKGDDLEQAIAAALADKKLFENADAEREPRFPVVRFEPAAAKPLHAGAPAVVVLDDTDPDFDDKTPHDDRLRVLNSSGEELWSVGGLNGCMGTGGVHGVVIDRRRNRIYARENLAHRIAAFTAQGQKLWQAEKVDADSLAVDEKTGNVWCTGGRMLNEGETVVFDPQGNEVAAWPYRGIDMAYDPHDDAFWLVGYELIKLNRKGEILFRKRVDGWSCASVSVNPADGSVWIAERSHPDLPRSKNRLWHLNADGSVGRELNLGERDVFVVASDPKTGDAWISGYNFGLRRIPITAGASTTEPASGEPGEPLPIVARSISISPSGGDLWVATEDEVLKIDPSGKVLARSPFRKKSLQSWLMAF